MSDHKLATAYNRAMEDIVRLEDEVSRLRVLHDHLVLYGQEQAAEIERLRAREAELTAAHKEIARLRAQVEHLSSALEHTNCDHVWETWEAWRFGLGGRELIRRCTRCNAAKGAPQ